MYMTGYNDGSSIISPQYSYLQVPDQVGHIIYILWGTTEHILRNHQVSPLHNPRSELVTHHNFQNSWSEM